LDSFFEDDGKDFGDFPDNLDRESRDSAPRPAQYNVLPIDHMPAQTIQAIENGQYDRAPRLYIGGGIQQDRAPGSPAPPIPRPVGDRPVRYLPQADGEMEPKFPSLGIPLDKLNKLTIATGRLCKAIQRCGEMTVRQMQEVGMCDNKRVYDVVNGMCWAGIIQRDRKAGVVRFCGAVTDEPIEIDELADLRGRLRAEREKKADELEALKARLRAFKEGGH
jgi:hypothetical protein